MSKERLLKKLEELKKLHMGEIDFYSDEQHSLDHSILINEIKYDESENINEELYWKKIYFWEILYFNPNLKNLFDLMMKKINTITNKYTKKELQKIIDDFNKDLVKGIFSQTSDEWKKNSFKYIKRYNDLTKKTLATSKETKYQKKMLKEKLSELTKFYNLDLDSFYESSRYNERLKIEEEIKGLDLNIDQDKNKYLKKIYLFEIKWYNKKLKNIYDLMIDKVSNIQNKKQKKELETIIQEFDEDLVNGNFSKTSKNINWKQNTEKYIKKYNEWKNKDFEIKKKPIKNKNNKITLIITFIYIFMVILAITSKFYAFIFLISIILGVIWIYFGK